MTHWHSSPHPISDIRDWTEAGRLELRPDFQRREVWSNSAKIMLMDSILRDIPIPKIFLANTIRNGSTYRVVIDGQQRIIAILEYLNNKFALDDPYVGDEKGKKFSELSKDYQDRFLSYQIDFNEATNPTDKEVRDVYARVNKYTVALNRQELRRADFPGAFLDLSEELAVHEYFEDSGIFSAADRRRYLDVEYVSELLAAMIEGIQDKKKTLDDFYIKYSKWDNSHKKEILNRFLEVLRELNIIFSSPLYISKTRFRQKADFYTLFLVIDEFIVKKVTAQEKDVVPLQEDLAMLQEEIRPESDIDICSEYAIKCVSQGNSASSRRWRHRFIKSILAGTYIGGQPDDDGKFLLYKLADARYNYNDWLGIYCPGPMPSCSVCENEISNTADCVLAWPRSVSVHQFSNAEWLHRSCVENQFDWLFSDRPNDDQISLF